MKKTFILTFSILYLLLGNLCYGLRAEQCFSSVEESDCYNLAFKAYQDKLYPVAGHQFEVYLKEYPRSKIKNRIYPILGEVYFYEGKLKMSERMFKKVYRKKKSRDIAGFWLAKINEKKGNTEYAESSFASFEKKYPGSKYIPYAEFELGQIDLKNGLLVEAVHIYEKLSQSYPGRKVGEQSRLELAKCYYKSRRYNKANAELKNFIGRVKDKELVAEAYFLLAQVNEALGLRIKAIRYFRRAAKELKNPIILAQAYYALGWDYWQIKHFDYSSIWFNLILKRFPKSRLIPAVRLRLAECFISLKNYPKAILQLEKFISENPKHKNINSIIYWLAETYSAAGMDNNARALYEKLIKASVYLGRAYYGMGWLYYREKEYKKSRAMFYKAIEKSRDEVLNAEVLLKIGDMYCLEKNFTDAIQIYTQILEKYPGKKSDRVLYQMADAYEKAGRLDKAVASFGTLIYGYPKSRLLMIARYKEGNIYFKQGLFKKALNCYKEVFDKTVINSLKERALFKRGITLYNMGRYNDAEKVFNSLFLKFSKGNYRVQALYELGLCAYRQGREDAMFRYFHQYIQNVQGTGFSPEINFWIGTKFFNKLQFDTANTSFLNIANKFPENELADDSLFLAARCEFKLGMYNKSKGIFQRLIKEYPGSSLIPDAEFGIAEDFIFLKKYNDALKIYEVILKKWPENYLIENVYIRQGDVLYGLGRFSDALKSYGQAAKSPYINIRLNALFDIAMVLQKQGMFSKAQDRYLRIVYKYPKEKLWIGKAAMKAAGLFVKDQHWNEALQLYRKVIESKCPESEQAKNKIAELKKIKEKE